MNIAKQQELLVLQREVLDLETKYNETNAILLSNATASMLSDAIQELRRFLEDEGFTIDGRIIEGAEYQVSAILEPGVSVQISRKPRIFSLRMSNGENYSVSVESTLEPLATFDFNVTGNQDTTISRFKNRLTEVRKLTDSLELQEFRYITGSEIYRNGDIEYPRKSYRTFKDALKVMFS